MQELTHYMPMSTILQPAKFRPLYLWLIAPKWIKPWHLPPQPNPLGPL